RLDYHAARLKSSAGHFNFEQPDFKAAIAAYIKENKLKQGIFKLRAVLSAAGQLKISHDPLAPDSEPLTAVFAAAPIQGAPDFIAHITKVRHQYSGKTKDSEVILYYYYIITINTTD